MAKQALFAGSFDPFTIGHYSVVKRALPMFDKITIGIGINSGKKSMFPVEERVKAIEKAFAGEERIEVKVYDCLTMDFAKEIGADVLLRGVRTTKDFEYEREIADINLKLGGIETVLLISEPEYASISSSVVRELITYGKDVSELLP
ncbi:MAG: pantetheine-phosphate adenylyltransferase [Bacteroidaceae bacterium]|jgi:pantetheine-phosphate adenylyltransferase|nr:pantetheine-phosphate adenylyltransferase [Bacteroidaceae bacterium]